MPVAELMKLREVALLLKVGDGAVRRWIRNGQLAAIRTPGGQYRVDPRAVQKLMAQLPPDEVAVA